MPVSKEAALKELARRELAKRASSAQGPERLGFFETLEKGPLVDIKKGGARGLAAVSKPLAGVANFLNVPERFNVPQQSVDLFTQISEAQPESVSTGPAKFINELIGESPGVVAEFAQGGALLKGAGVSKNILKLAGGQKLLPAAQLAVTKALEELGEGAGPAIKAGTEAGTIGLAFPVAGKGLGLLKQGFKEGARKLIQITTNNKRLAEDFVENPFKYSLRFFDKNVKTVKEAQRVNKEIKQSMIDRHSNELNTLKTSQRAQKEELVVSQKEAANNLSARSLAIKENLQREGQIKVDVVREQTNRAIQDHKASVGQRLNNDLSQTYDFANKLRQQEGELVGDAIEGIVAINPTAGIPIKDIMPGVREALSQGARRGLFRFKKNKVEAVTSGQRELASGVNRFLSDLNRLKTTKKEVPLEVLQGLKNDARGIAQRAYQAGDGSTGSIFSELSNRINPAKIVSENSVLSGRMQALAEANARFAKQIKPYNDLTKLMTTTDANGQVVVNPSIIISGVKNNNTQIINRLRKVDAALPSEQRVLPKVRQYISDVEKAASQQKAFLSKAKRDASEVLKTQSEKASKLQKNLQKNQKSDRFKLNEEQRSNLRNESVKRQERLRKLTNELDDEINFLEDQDDIRAFQGHGLSGLLQRVFAFGTVLPAFTDLAPTAAVGGLAVTAGLSPNIIGSSVQTAARASAKLTPLIRDFQEKGAEELIKRLVASRVEG